MQKLRAFARKHLLTFGGVIAGGIAGYFYWQYVGCDSGSCSITSDPFNSSAYGAVMGGLIFSMFQKK